MLGSQRNWEEPCDKVQISFACIDQLLFMRLVLFSEFRSRKGWGKFGSDSTVLLFAKKATTGLQ